MWKYLTVCSTILVLVGSPGCNGGDVPVDHACPAGWDQHLTRCYWFLDIKKISWEQANSDCHDIGGYLYVPSSDEEGIFVQDALESRDSFASISEAVWIGCDDREKEGTYICHEEGGDTGYRHWAVNEPSDSWNLVWGEDCISAYTGRPNNSVVPLWNDKACNGVSYHAVCERSATNLYTIVRRFHMPSPRSSALMIPDYCLLKQPDLKPEGITTSSLIRCAASCANDPVCQSFNFFRERQK
nr:perlucin-like protein [Lytechinus pictus]